MTTRTLRLNPWQQEYLKNPDWEPVSLDFSEPDRFDSYHSRPGGLFLRMDKEDFEAFGSPTEITVTLAFADEERECFSIVEVA